MSPETKLGKAIDAAVGWTRSHQHPSGYWVGDLDTNSTMEAEWILGMHILGVRNDPKLQPVVHGILEQQRADGSWGVFYEAPTGEVSATVECYAALRCAGIPPDSPALVRARQWILAHGGLAHLRVFTKMWLALLGEWPWDGTPQLPPEVMLLPGPWCPFNIYHFSSWARATLVPLAVVSALRPRYPLPCGPLDELFPDGRDAVDYRLPRRAPALSWESLFLAADRMMRWYYKSPVKPFRKLAIKVAIEWIVSHQEADGAWGGIQPPWIYALIALHTCGYAVDHPVIARGIRAFDEPWAVRRGDSIFLQASNSPVWDTMLTLWGLLDCDPGLLAEDFATRGLRWLLGQEVRVPGDWQVVTPGLQPSGWSFELENDWYPDLDDTAVVVELLARIRDAGIGPEASRLSEVIDRACGWLLPHQCSNGGWASFDRNNDHAYLTKIPFCDFGEVLDPPSVDVTAHVVEALGWLGRDRDDPLVRRALAFIEAEQEPEGPWFGRWGVNYIYGTGAVLPALSKAGCDMTAPRVRKAVDWLLTRQNGDGGWGETCSSYMAQSLRGVGASTASQTAWALLGLLAVDDPRLDAPILRGLDFLLRTQRPDGTWDEPFYTGTGFPGYGIGKRVERPKTLAALPQGIELGRGFMLRYNMYRHYFPLIALGRARRRFQGGGTERDWAGSAAHSEA
jgi:squalene-hopene/tetraprenyl-beta-curcumene cyclase